jgi:hypothetical protein
MTIQACSAVQPTWMQEVLNSYATDPAAQSRLTQLAIASPDEHGYELSQGIIRFQGRVWIGANAALQTKLIAALHSSAVGGHSGIQATYQRVKRLFAWPGLKTAVDDFVSSVTFVSTRSIPIPTQQACFSLYLFQPGHGKISRWTS